MLWIGDWQGQGQSAFRRGLVLCLFEKTLTLIRPIICIWCILMLPGFCSGVYLRSWSLICCLKLRPYVFYPHSSRYYLWILAPALCSRLIPLNWLMLLFWEKTQVASKKDRIAYAYSYTKRISSTRKQQIMLRLNCFWLFLVAPASAHH